ncbi:MAG: hypothetical protein FWF31_07895 [Desulfobulbus sp.]|nr:hypothetical protein [Desulfobulbus sp.]
MKKNINNSSPALTAPPDRWQWLAAKGWASACLLIAALLTACAGARPEQLPQMTASAPGQMTDRCAAFFPKGRWQMVHAINFRLADGRSGNALGVTVLDGRSLSCAMMTVEGLTLFESRSPDHGAVEVLRALPPFNSQAFAEGLVADVRTLFHLPAGTASVGHLADGRGLCRFAGGPEVTDVLPGTDGCFTLSTYSRPSASADNLPVRTRTVVGRDCSPVGESLMARYLILTGHGSIGYTLQLHLLSAEPLPAVTP